jgi:two-component system chemotaxis response regulator CheB
MHPVRARENAPLSKSTQPIDAQTIVVAIATSTGGPATLQELIPQLHTEPNAAYLLVQHMPPGFTQSLAERLNRTSRLAVREAKTGDSIERGLVLIAPGGHHLTVDAQGIVALNDEPPLWGVRPAADVLMHSVANHFGPRSLAVVLTGMGRDGALGAKAIVQAGGTCLAQDEATSVIYGMPRAALEVGAASQSVALGQMAAEIERHLAAQSAARGHRAA